MNRINFIVPSCLLALAACLGGCQREETPVSFSGDVRPILDRACASCHVPGEAGYEASGLSLATYDALMEGTRYGPVIVRHDPDNSVLVMLIEGRADPSINMPHGGLEPLYHGEIEAIRNWVAQGARDN